MYDLPSLENVSKVVVDESVINHQTEPYLIYTNTPWPPPRRPRPASRPARCNRRSRRAGLPARFRFRGTACIGSQGPAYAGPARIELDTPAAPAHVPTWRRPWQTNSDPHRSAGPAAARRRGLPAHGDPAVRRPRPLDPGARHRDGRRQADPAGRAEEPRRRRPRRRRTCIRSARSPPCCSCSSCPTAPSRCWSKACRAWRSTAIGEQRRRADRPPATSSNPSYERDEREMERHAGLADGPVRAVREDQPQAAAGAADHARRHRRSRPPGRHHRRAPGRAPGRQAAAARDPRGRRSAWRC